MAGIPDLADIPITLGPDGLYHAKVTVGRKASGQLDRRHCSGKTVEAVKRKLRRLLRALNAGSKPGPGRVPTVEAWFDTWLTTIANVGRRKLAPRTLDDYGHCAGTGSSHGSVAYPSTRWSRSTWSGCTQPRSRRSSARAAC
jgi:hypothetical protein